MWNQPLAPRADSSNHIRFCKDDLWDAAYAHEYVRSSCTSWLPARRADSDTDGQAMGAGGLTLWGSAVRSQWPSFHRCAKLSATSYAAVWSGCAL